MKRDSILNIRMNNSEYYSTIISKFLIVFCGFLNTILINRFLGPELKGEYSYLINISNITVLFLGFGIGQAYSYFKKRKEDKSKEKFITLFFLQLIIYSFSFILIIESTFLIKLLFIYTILTIFYNQLVFFAIVENINLRNRLAIFNTCFYTFLLCFLQLLFQQDIILLFIIIIIKILIDIILIIFKYRIMNFVNVKAINFLFIKKVLKFAFFPMLSSLLITFNYNIDIIIMKNLISFTEIGYYSVAVNLASMMWIIPDAFKEVLFKRTANEDCIQEIVKSIKVNFCIALIVIVGFAFIGEIFISLAYGEQFTKSYFPSLILLVGTIPMIFFKLINTLYIANGKQKYTFIILFIATVINIILNCFLIPSVGIIGAAISSVISYTICGLVFLNSFCKDYNINMSSIFILKKQDLIQLRRVLLK